MLVIKHIDDTTTCAAACRHLCYLAWLWPSATGGRRRCDRFVGGRVPHQQQPELPWHRGWLADAPEAIGSGAA